MRSLIRRSEPWTDESASISITLEACRRPPRHVALARYSPAATSGDSLALFLDGMVRASQSGYTELMFPLGTKTTTSTTRAPLEEGRESNRSFLVVRPPPSVQATTDTRALISSLPPSVRRRGRGGNAGRTLMLPPSWLGCADGN